MNSVKLNQPKKRQLLFQQQYLACAWTNHLKGMTLSRFFADKNLQKSGNSRFPSKFSDFQNYLFYSPPLDRAIWDGVIIADYANFGGASAAHLMDSCSKATHRLLRNWPNSIHRAYNWPVRSIRTGLGASKMKGRPLQGRPFILVRFFLLN